MITRNYLAFIVFISINIISINTFASNLPKNNITMGQNYLINSYFSNLPNNIKSKQTNAQSFYVQYLRTLSNNLQVGALVNFTSAVQLANTTIQQTNNSISYNIKLNSSKSIMANINYSFYNFSKINIFSFAQVGYSYASIKWNTKITDTATPNPNKPPLTFKEKTQLVADAYCPKYQEDYGKGGVYQGDYDYNINTYKFDCIYKNGSVTTIVTAPGGIIPQFIESFGEPTTTNNVSSNTNYNANSLAYSLGLGLQYNIFKHLALQGQIGYYGINQVMANGYRFYANSIGLNVGLSLMF